MASTVRGILGLSILLTLSVGCDDGSGAGSGPLPAGGSSNGAGGGGGTGSTLPPGVPLTPTDGWVDSMSNTLGVVGAMFSYSDMFSATGLTSDFVGTDKACMAGTAAQVMMPCEIVPPATDCYGTYWGAAIGLNMNQPIDPVTMEGVEVPLPYDAATAGITGFAFEITGDTIPAPGAFRFKVEDATGEYCTPTAKGIKAGVNQYVFADLVKECWAATPGANAEAAKPAILKIAWQVVTNTSAAVPFNFCVSKLVATQ